MAVAMLSVVLIVDGNRRKLVLYYFQYSYFMYTEGYIYIVKKNNDLTESK